MLSTAIDAEVAERINSQGRLTHEEGSRQVVRNGRLPQRSIMTGVDEVYFKRQVATMSSLTPLAPTSPSSSRLVLVS